MRTSPRFAGMLESFFTERLMRQRQVSPHTIASYRDTFRLLLKFVQCKLKKAPSALAIEDLSAPVLSAFLDHLEKERGISPRSRNVRLAAIRSFFKYAAYESPEQAGLIQRVLAMPSKRFDRAAIEFLDRHEIQSLLEAPDIGTWSGRRDWLLLTLAVQAGLRVSELVALCCQDVVLRIGAHVRCWGKGRKERCIPLSREAVAALRYWLKQQNAQPNDPLFPSARGGPLSRDAVEYLLKKHMETARQRCPSLKGKRVSPHVLRHSAAMDLLRHGVDRSTIALWLGHESVETTQVYLHADLALKEAALARITPVKIRAGRYRPDDRLLAFLKSL
ncbi:MAG: tyrosine-type recombinase/integrase [Candidatus Eisenbacteria bacterium]